MTKTPFFNVTLTVAERECPLHVPRGFRVERSVIHDVDRYAFTVAGQGFKVPVSITMLAAYAAHDDDALRMLVQKKVDQALAKIERAQKAVRS